MKDILENSPFGMESGNADTQDQVSIIDKTLNPMFEYEIEQTPL